MQPQAFFNAHRGFYTQKLLHTESFYTQKLLHTGAFTHRTFYTQKPLHTESFYTQKLLHTESFYTQKLLHTEDLTHRKLLHTGAFTHRTFYTQKPLHTESFYTQKPLHTESFYTQKLLHREAFTHRCRSHIQPANLVSHANNPCFRPLWQQPEGPAECRRLLNTYNNSQDICFCSIFGTIKYLSPNLRQLRTKRVAYRAPLRIGRTSMPMLPGCVFQPSTSTRRNPMYTPMACYSISKFIWKQSMILYAYCIHMHGYSELKTGFEFQHHNSQSFLPSKRIHAAACPRQGCQKRITRCNRH